MFGYQESSRVLLAYWSEHSLVLSLSGLARPEMCAMQGPHEMLACASLLGDLFPAAWPPSGAARPGQGSHAPPAHMRYRAALAKSFEPLTQDALRTLMACAAASDSLIFRAALVRLCARASGAFPSAMLSICNIVFQAQIHQTT